MPETSHSQNPQTGSSLQHDDIPNLYQTYSDQKQSMNISALQILDYESHDKKADEDVTKRRTVINLHGRAGIGKSTTLQWLFRKWAQGEWATSYTAIFLIPLRRLLTCQTPISLIDMLKKYNLYRSKKGHLYPEWLLSNQMRVIVSLDGLDEMNLSRDDFQNAPEITDISEASSPLDIAINLIRGKLLPGSTLINCSRHLQGPSEISQCQSFEIQGLSQEGILSFISTRYEKPAVERIKKILQGRPLLLSVCSITYYCSVITRLLNDDPTLKLEGVDTYTRLHSFIIQNFAFRSLKTDFVALELQPIIPKLANLAFQGLYGKKRVRSQIIFQEKDMLGFGIYPEDIEKAIKLGILVRAHHEKTAIQFFHLSLQEFLAVAYMTMEETDLDHNKVRSLLKMFLAKKMDLAILYMFGFKYDDENSWRHHILGKTGKEPREKHMHEFLSDILHDVCSMGDLETKMINDLFCCQLAYESQSQNIAKQVAGHIIQSRAFLLGNISITALEIEAIIFTCSQVTTLERIELVHINLDDISVTIISEFLKTNGSVRVLSLSSNHIKLQGMGALSEMLEANKSLQSLIMNSCYIEDDGIVILVSGLDSNSTLKGLSLADNLISNQGAVALANSLKKNRTLVYLCLTCNQISHIGIDALNDTFNAVNQMNKEGKREVKITYELKSNPCDLNLCKKRFPGFIVSMLQMGPSLNLSKLAKTRKVHLHDACLSDGDIANILPFVSNSEVVQEVLLQNNSLTTWSFQFLNALVFTCKNLRCINLSGNTFKTEAVDAFMDLSVRAKLKSLNIYHPSTPLLTEDMSQVATLTDPTASLPNVSSIISSQGCLESLTLHAYFMRLEMTELKYIEGILKHCHEMKQLSIKGTIFIGEHFEGLVSCMQVMKTLECIRFTQCQMHILSLEKLLDAIGSMSWLKEVSIVHMGNIAIEPSIESQLRNPLLAQNEKSINWRIIQRTLTAVKELCTRMQRFDKLAVLNLSSAYLSDTGALSISSLLSHCATMQSLSLMDCQIGSRGCEYLGEALASNRTLQELRLDRNPIGDNGVKYLSEGITKNQTLLSLSIQGSGFSDSGVEHLSKALKENSTLQVLDLRGPRIDRGAVALRDSLRVNKVLIRLGMPLIMDVTFEKDISALIKRNNTLSSRKEGRKYTLSDSITVKYEIQIKQTVRQ